MLSSKCRREGVDRRVRRKKQNKRDLHCWERRK